VYLDSLFFSSKGDSSELFEWLAKLSYRAGQPSEGHYSDWCIAVFSCHWTNIHQVRQPLLQSCSIALYYRALCEGLLGRLDLKNELVWTEGLSLITRVIGGVDYKASHPFYCE